MKNVLLLLATALLFMANACKKNDTKPQIAPDTEDTQSMRQYLTDMYGFAPESIEETENDFIVEKDIAFSKANFWEDYGRITDHIFMVDGIQTDDHTAGDRRHYRGSYLTNYNLIKVNIKGDVTSEWKTAILAAISAWNNTGGRILFQPTYLNYSVLGSINIEMNEYLQDDDIAICYLPTSNARPGSPMYINPDYNSLSASKKKATIMHEIGHAIAMRHTDMGVGSLISNVSGTCRNTPDAYSIMHNYNWNYNFSGCDLEAYDALYPL